MWTLSLERKVESYYRGLGFPKRPECIVPTAHFGLIAGGSFCGLGFAVGLVALTWRYCKRRKQVKIAQH